MITITYIIIWFSYIFSVRAKNLNKVGLNYSFFQLKVFEWEKPWFVKNTISILYQLLINPLFSWITVFLSWYWLIKLVNEKLSTPEKVKEIQYKLWHNIYSKEEVIELLREIATFNWKWKEFNEALSLSWNLEDEDDNTLINEDKYWYYYEVTIDKDKNLLYTYDHTPDYDIEHRETLEYKVEWKEVLIKLLDKNIMTYWDEYSQVKDGIILESEIIKKSKEDSFKFIEPKEEVISLKKEIIWHNLKNDNVIFFILSKHLDKKELQNHFRNELENINLMITKINDICSKYNWSFKYDEESDLESYKIEWLDNLKEKDLKKVYWEIEKVAEEHWYWNKWFYWIKEKKDLLEKYLK